MTRSAQDFDLVVIGGGSGGVRAARVAAGHGARVAIVESYRYGGTCVIRGCVPKKLLVMASEFASQAADARGFGWQLADPRHHWAALRDAKDREIARLEAIYRQLLADAGALVINGRGRLDGPNRVDVDGQTLHAPVILVATGAAPWQHPMPGSEWIISSNEAFDLPALPPRIVVLGGGYIACEFAGIFNGLGARVTQLHRGTQVLRGFDDDVREHATREIARSGVDLRLGAGARGVARTPQGLRVALADGSFVEADAVLGATGRRANTQGLGLEAAGVATDAYGAIVVDALARTSVDGIHAVGDVTNGPQLTPVAIRQGHAFADRVFGGVAAAAELALIPTAVFSQPQVAAVGWSEAQALRAGHAVAVYMSSFRPMKATLSGREQRVLVKLVVDGASDRVLGAHMVGGEAAEVMQGLAVALQAGATKAQVDATLGIHPTAAEEFVTLREPVRRSLPPPG